MRKLSLPDKAYGNLLKFILDENITDINWSQGLWVNDLNKGRYKIKGFTLDDNFIQQFYTRISNLMNVQFNKNNPLLEAETDNLRISILHDSVTNTGISISIRKTPAVRRINRDSIVKDDYCNGDIDTFMEMIEFMVEDDKRMKEMGERGYRFLCENYTVDKSYKAIMKHF